MDPASTQTRPRRRRWFWLAAPLVLLAGLALAYVSFFPRSRAPISDPRLTITTPFLNVQPDIGYVGDETCARCHETIMKDYRNHSMGRSLAPVATAAPVERLTPEARNPFSFGKLRYSVERQGDRMLHREEYVKGERVLTELATQVDVAIGSGDRARSYFICTDGFVFQSAITWFGHGQRWNLSPGFEKDNPHFSRPANARCMFCHTNHVEPVAHTINRYHEPIFRGDAIGCERCHGPGALHVERREWREHMDVTIVNPRHLQAGLREAVCEQCHLEAQWRVMRRGRGDFDYRPGLPLREFMSIYVKPEGHDAELHFVGHVEQFHVSKCYQKSAGKMGCISCHDPHRLPTKDERVSFYRQRCLQCHETKPCAEPVARRLTVSKEDSCIQCHMPAAPSEIQHTAVTNHAIRRRPHRARPAPSKPASSEFQPFVLYDPEGLVPAGPERDRDYAIAVAEVAESQGLRTLRAPAEARRTVAALLLPLVEVAARRDWQDWPLREAQAATLWMAERTEEAAAVYQEVLRRVPEREPALVGAAALAQEMQRPKEAVALWRRALAVNPHNWVYHQHLGAALAEQQDWWAALEPLRECLRQNPVCLEARKLVVACLLELGERQRAEAEFRQLVDLGPPDLPELQRWYESRTAK